MTSLFAARSTDQNRIEQACYLVGAALIAAGACCTSWWRWPTRDRGSALVLAQAGDVRAVVRADPDRDHLGGLVPVTVAPARTVLLGVFAVDCVVEVPGITVQAWRHVPSHLNNTTPLNAVIAFSMSFGGGVLVVVLGALAVTAWHGGIDAAPSMRLALRAGFGLLVAGLFAGAAMIAPG